MVAEVRKDAEALRSRTVRLDIEIAGLTTRAVRLDMENVGLTTRVQASERRIKLLEGSVTHLRELPPGDLIDLQQTIGEAAFKVNDAIASSAAVCQICVTKAVDWSLFCGHRGCKECFTKMKDIAVRTEEERAFSYEEEPAPRMQCHTCRMQHPIARVLVNGEPGEWQLCGHASY